MIYPASIPERLRPRMYQDLYNLIRRANHQLTYDDLSEDNLSRAAWAATGVVAMGEVTFGDSDEECETAIGDLLGNLRHLCDALGLDFAALDARGRHHYVEELAGR